MNTAENIQSHKTAIARTSLSLLAKLVLASGVIGKSTLFNEPTKVLDYGCGRGGDVERLRNMGIDIVGFDPYFNNDLSLLENKYEVVINSHVLNAVPERSQRVEIVKKLFELSTKYVAIAARCDGKGKVGIAYNDGIITKNNTFQKYYTNDELVDFVRECHGPLVYQQLGVGMILVSR